LYRENRPLKNSKYSSIGLYGLSGCEPEVYELDCAVPVRHIIIMRSARVVTCQTGVIILCALLVSYTYLLFACLSYVTNSQKYDRGLTYARPHHLHWLDIIKSYPP